MKNKICNNKERLYEIFVMIGGILMLGVVMPLIIGSFTRLTVDAIITNVLTSTIGSTLLWMGCRFIILNTWNLFPWEKHPVKHLIVEILSIVIYNLLIVKLIFWGYGLIIQQAVVEYNFIDVFVKTVIISLVISFIHEGVYLYFEWMKSNKRSQELERESLLSQFETLKNQVNPHFLFNSFNTLITLIEEDKKDAVEYVQKLSDFFRTILQLRDKSIITIEEELELIQTYSYLQMKRYGENLILSINVSPENRMKYIAPLSLQMLVENAIKHNVIATGRPLSIEIISTENGYIQVKNNIQKRTEEEPSAGLGLQNIRNRYKFLSDKEVEVMISAQHFSVALPVLEENLNN
ncbi:MAG: histidine kinase [Bacteroidetes bacterium]|nr:histidine kinase [Bacteroidota bacterium]